VTIAAKPVTLRHWSCIDVLNPLGQVVMTFKIGNHNADDQLLMVFMNPRAVEIVKVLTVSPGGEMVPILAKTLPHLIRDLAESVCRDHFPQRKQAAS
jgi:hypothetical protein